MLRKVPLIVILGSTGTGKTKLSLELAERFGSEIISADSMQVYADLDIATAKATKAEQSRVRHHLLDVATPAEPYTVVHFRNAALPIVGQLLAKSQPPLIVGGTNYYIESLLWDVLVSDEFDAHSAQVDMKKKAVADALSSAEITALTSEQLHKRLATFDAASAARIHPNNGRKIIRAIEVYQMTGQTLSEKLHSQRRQPGGNRLGGPLRYKHTILLWLRCEQSVLNERLEKRVDDMLSQGLLPELRAFHNKYNVDGVLAQAYTRGVLQTIGYKEFMPYLLQYNAEDDARLEAYLRAHNYQLPNAVDDKASNSTEWPPGLPVLALCLAELKRVTQRYAKKQIKWINNRFLASSLRQVPDLYELDTTVVQNWPENVYARAVSIIDCYRNEQPSDVQPMEKRVHPAVGLDEETSHFCVCCQRHFVGEYQWQDHMRSKKHKKRKDTLRKQSKLLPSSDALQTSH